MSQSYKRCHYQFQLRFFPWKYQDMCLFQISISRGRLKTSPCISCSKKCRTLSNLWPYIPLLCRKFNCCCAIITRTFAKAGTVFFFPMSRRPTCFRQISNWKGLCKIFKRNLSIFSAQRTINMLFSNSQRQMAPY